MDQLQCRSSYALACGFTVFCLISLGAVAIIAAWMSGFRAIACVEEAFTVAVIIAVLGLAILDDGLSDRLDPPTKLN